MKKFLREELLKRFGNSYQVDSNTHIDNLRKLKEDIDKEYSPILNNQKVYFGRIQKIVNLYLKYRWVCFQDPKPAHCPFDRIILNKLNLNMSWTSMTEDQYAGEVLTKAKNAAGGFEKIAEWELDFFNRTNQTYLRKVRKVTPKEGDTFPHIEF